MSLGLEVKTVSKIVTEGTLESVLHGTFLFYPIKPRRTRQKRVTNHFCDTVRNTSLVSVLQVYEVFGLMVGFLFRFPRSQRGLGVYFNLYYWGTFTGSRNCKHLTNQL